MKNLIKLLTIVIIIFSGLSIKESNAQRNVNKSHWYNANKDTVNNETDIKSMLYDKRSGMLYKVSNDSSQFFVELKINNETVQKKILMFGLTVWVDATGKTKKNIGIKYPRGRKEFGSQARGKGMKKNRTNFNIAKHQISKRYNQIVIIDKKKGKENKILDKRYKNSFKPEIKFDKLGMMYYQIYIPFEKLNMSFADITVNNPSIGFETGHLDIEQMKSQRAGMHGGKGSGGGRGGKGQGAGRSGGNKGMSADREAMLKSTSLWLKRITIAKNN